MIQLKVVREIGVDTGELMFNLQSTQKQEEIIEMNPRVSRSSALALRQPA